MPIIQFSNTENYKTFIALLTQSGGLDVQTQTSGSLVIGKTYEITILNAGDNFINVGAPSNTLGIKFIATGTTPQNWTNASELTYNNGAPIANIIQNTIGNIYFEFTTNGGYDCLIDNLLVYYGFFIGPPDTQNGVVSITTFPIINGFRINTVDFLGVATNEGLLNTLIEIRVFN
jgi:hypothetical protein